MALTAREALDRTALLINADFFNNTLDCDQVVDSLLATTVRIAATAQDLASPAGQTALVATTALIGMLGIAIDLDMPAAEMLTPQPPLVGDELRAALLDHGQHMIPGARIAHGLAAQPDVTFALGTAGTTVDLPSGAIAVTGDDTSCTVGPLTTVRPAPWITDWPMGALAAACAAAGEAFRVALARIAGDSGLPYPTMCRPPRRDVVTLTMGAPHPTPVDLGEIDVVSAGAITNALTYCLLRTPDITGHLRFYDDDTLEVSNLNRYALMRQQDIDTPKTQLLERFSTDSLALTGILRRYDEHTTSSAPRILVGADDIPVRWTAQRRQPDWLGIGATGHTYALVSTHTPDTPCAGCIHDHDDPEPNPVIPTISVVSFLAGLQLASELIEFAAGTSAPGEAIAGWPLGLGGSAGWTRSKLQHNASCPIHAAQS